MRKKPKAPSKTSLEKQCLSLWSLCVRTRDRKCRICGSEHCLQGHHIRSRSHKATYLDIENGLAACARCHIIQKFNPELFQDRVIEVIGDVEYQRLKQKSQYIWKPTVYELKMMKDTLIYQLKLLRGEYGFLEIADDAGL